MKQGTYRFPSFMREQRAQRKWSIAQTARAIRHSQTYVKNCEDGNIGVPREETQREIALAFGVPLSEVREALGLSPIVDTDTDRLSTTLVELGGVLRECPPDRFHAIVDVAKTIASMK